MSARRLALLAAAGLAAGAAAAFFLLPAGAKSAAVTSTTEASATATTSAPVWVNDHETRLGSTVVVATGLQMEGSRILFTYDLYPIAPLETLATLEELPELFAGTVPASFTLIYPGGTTTARPLGPGQRAGRFEVPAGVTTAEVEAITIDSYWVPVPGGYTVGLSPSSGAWVAAAPGVRARIVQVVEQAENRLVIVELEGEAIIANDLAIAGEGRDWQSSSYSQIGGLRWTLDFRGEVLPDPVVLTVRGVGWIEVPGGGPVDLEGVPR
ncbi:MAG: hypothetical protein MUE66_03865 [Acidimicrobiia bacterium]|nr:hypothetical protein [Acidimicrobiia bacterium]